LIRQSSLVALYSILLLWLPFFGPLIGGYLGTKKINNITEAVMIAVIPMVVLGIGSIVFFQKITFIKISSIGVVVFLTLQQVGVLAGVVLKGLKKK